MEDVLEHLNDHDFGLALVERFDQISREVPDPVFLQIGANDGQLAENLHHSFMSSDWRAVMLEPLPDLFEKLRKTYASKPKFRLINAALTPQDGVANIRRIPPEDVRSDELWAHGIASLEDAPQSSFKAGGEVSLDLATDLTARSRLEEIKTISFSTLVKQTGLDKIDYLQIDTEGYDLIVLRQVDFSLFEPRLICCEIFNLSESDRSEVVKLLQSLHYNIVLSRWDVLAFK
jgi:FkbM family methyltransferase